MKERRSTPASNAPAVLDLWPPAVPSDAVAAIPDAGAYARSFVRLLAWGLTEGGALRPRVRFPTSARPDGKRAWVVAGRAWKAGEALDAAPADASGIGYGLLEGGPRWTYGVVCTHRRTSVFERTLDGGLGGLVRDLPAYVKELTEAWTCADATPPAFPFPDSDEFLRDLFSGLDVAGGVSIGVALVDPARAFDPLLRCVQAAPAVLLPARTVLSMALTWAEAPDLPLTPAKEAVERLRHTLPGLAAADAVLAELHLTGGDVPAALEAATRFARRSDREPGRDAYAHQLLGRIHERAGSVDAAAAAYASAVRADPSRTGAWRALAGLAVAQGRLEEADRCLERALEAKPADPELLEARRRLREARARARASKGPLRVPGDEAP